MGTLLNGRYVSDTEEAVIDAMMADAKQYFGDDLNDSDEAVIRLFYLPAARRFVEVQNNLSLILDSSQIQHATGKSLDLLTALIGVPRKTADKSTGEVEISISSADSVDHNISRGTKVSTNSSDPIVFETTDKRTLKAGNTSITAPVKAVEGGTNSNVGQNTLVNFPSGSPFPNASVTNPFGTTGGKDREGDSELQDRAQDELADGARATGPALVSQVQSIEGVYDVTIFINDTPNIDGRGHNLPPHSFEIVTATDGTDETLKSIAQTLMETKAVGDVSVTGENGDPLDSGKSFVTADGEINTTLPNDQTHPVGFSLSATVTIYVDIDIQVTEDYRGDDEVRRLIVDYLGGTDPDGSDQDGELSVNEDVVHSKIQRAIMDVDGVYDINSAYIGKSSNPTSTNNISIGAYEQAVTKTESTNQHVTLTTTQV